LAGRLKGKIALVTAAGQGIGRAIAQALLPKARGDRDRRRREKLKAEEATLARLDARSTADGNALVKEIEKDRPIDVLVNAPAIVHHGSVLDATDEDWDFAFDLNVRSMDRTIKACLPAMLKKGKGSIINIASGASSVRGIPFRYVYGTTKAAVIGLTKSVAADFIRKGVRSNAICPGTIETPSLDNRIATLAKKSGAPEKRRRQQFIDRQPMGRLGTPREIAALAVYLASDESSYTTGQIHLADGGFAM
jgi:2-keto-3-deoxy-L-fuconate dehydrogenase